MIKKLTTLALAFLIAATAGCASTNVAATSTSNNAKDYIACVVTEAGANVDRARSGIDKAQKDFGISTTFFVLKKNELPTAVLDRMVKEKCQLIIGVGRSLADDIVAHAKKHPFLDYALIGLTTPLAHQPKNLRNALWDIYQPAFLAGYAAAGTASTSIIYAFCEGDTPQNRQLLSAFAQGVRQYNDDVRSMSDTAALPRDVTVNIDIGTGEGRFLGSSPDAPDIRDEINHARQENASVIFAPLHHYNDLLLNEVAALDPITLDRKGRPVDDDSTTAAKKDTSHALSTVTLVWLDPNGHDKFSSLVAGAKKKNNPSWSDDGEGNTRIPPILTSVVLRTDIVIPQIVEDAKNTHLTNKPWSISLANDGTDISPFYAFDATVPSTVKRNLTGLTARFKEKTLKIEPIH